MNNLEKGAATVAIVVAIFGAGMAWNSLSNRIDKLDDKIGAIQKTLGSTPCTAILTRELAAIDKGRADVRKALDGLSSQYGCEPSQAVVEVPNFGEENAAEAAMNYDAERLDARLNAVDAILNKSH